MNGDFEIVWSDLQKLLISGTLVRYWSVEEGYTGGVFRIENVDVAAVIVRHGKMGQERRVSKRDFQHLFGFWAAYNCGTIGPTELSKRSENMSYILSILQWRDEAQSWTAPTLRISSVSIPPQSETVFATELVGGDDYGKRVLYEATEGRAVLHGPSVEIAYGAGPPARVDATVGDIAVQIEARVSTQVRGAVLDLICHPYPKKLLVLLPEHLRSRGITAEQCRNILGRFCPDGSFRVLLLKGSNSIPQLTEDTTIMAALLADLRLG
jgi:hypothetical protein